MLDDIKLYYNNSTEKYSLTFGYSPTANDCKEVTLDINGNIHVGQVIVVNNRKYKVKVRRGIKTILKPIGCNEDIELATGYTALYTYGSLFGKVALNITESKIEMIYHTLDILVVSMGNSYLFNDFLMGIIQYCKKNKISLSITIENRN